MTDPQLQQESQRFLKSLRTATQADHEALEAHPVSVAITAAQITPAAYTRYLQIMENVVQGMEGVLEPRLGEHVPDISQRRKAAWIAADLQALEAGVNPYPEFSGLPANLKTGEAFGAYYVLEGSALGGRVILKQLPEALRNGGSQTRYFEGYGTGTGPMWQRFLGDFSRYVLQTDAEREAVDGARTAFAAIYQYFNRCDA